jgi:Fe-S-cluster containining protein
LSFEYPEGVCFECSGCGVCCGDTDHKLRHILILESEAEAISALTGKPIEDFAVERGTAPYIYEMKKHEGGCVFLKNNKCKIYSERPMICRFYPFELKFDEEKCVHIFRFTKECPAINLSGRALTKRDFEELFKLAEERLL